MANCRATSAAAGANDRAVAADAAATTGRACVGIRRTGAVGSDDVCAACSTGTGRARGVVAIRAIAACCGRAHVDMRRLRIVVIKRRARSTRDAIVATVHGTSVAAGHVLTQVERTCRRTVDRVGQRDAAAGTRVATTGAAITGVAAVGIGRDRNRATRRRRTSDLSRRRHGATVAGLPGIRTPACTGIGRLGDIQRSNCTSTNRIDELAVGARSTVSTFIAVTARTAGGRRNDRYRAGAGIATRRHRLGRTTITARLSRAATVATTTAGRRGARIDTFIAVYIGAYGVGDRGGDATLPAGTEAAGIVDVATATTRGIVTRVDVILARGGCRGRAACGATSATHGTRQRVVDITAMPAVDVAVCPGIG